MRKITLIALALAASGIAAAQTLEVTSGAITAAEPFDGASFTFAGNGFSISGTTDFGFSPSQMGFTPGPNYDASFSDGTTTSLGITGLSGALGLDLLPGLDGGNALLSVQGGALITGPGAFTGDFTVEGSVYGLPAGAPIPTSYGCPGCVTVGFSGGGILTGIAEPTPNAPGGYLITQEAFTIVPEPGTLALFAFGLVGLATQRKRRFVPLRAGLH
jgi:PEP-CTERM motif-containing protein